MRVGIAALTLVPGRIGGSETYVRELIRALGRVGTCRYVALVSTLAADLGLDADVEVRVAAEYRAARGDTGRLLAMTAASLTSARIRKHLEGVDVVHYPLTVPLPRGMDPTVVTIHDVQHLDHPAMFSRSERAFRRLAYDRAARHATAVITISAFARDRIIQQLGIPPRSVHVVSPGVDHTRFRPGDGAREPFLLYPARIWPHKNHATLFEAFALLRLERPELRLVLTGGGQEELVAPPGVEIRGSVTLDELAELYRRASCLVFPSLYEGFGLPVLEAMASACPVAAAGTTAVAETCGDAAVLFDPTDPRSIAEGVSQALDRAPELSRLGPARAAGYTWDAAAAAHERVYRELAAGR